MLAKMIVQLDFEKGCVIGLKPLLQNWILKMVAILKTVKLHTLNKQQTRTIQQNLESILDFYDLWVVFNSLQVAKAMNVYIMTIIFIGHGMGEL